MASAEIINHHTRRPALATSYQGGDPALLEAVLPLVDFIEITPDTIAELTDDGSHPNPNTLAELLDIGPDAELIVHGVGLSIGSHDGCSEQYFAPARSTIRSVRFRMA